MPIYQTYLKTKKVVIKILRFMHQMLAIWKTIIINKMKRLIKNASFALRKWPQRQDTDDSRLAPESVSHLLKVSPSATKKLRINTCLVASTLSLITNALKHGLIRKRDVHCVMEIEEKIRIMN